jgi:predicted amidohydrolase YtcJ
MTKGNRQRKADVIIKGGTFYCGRGVRRSLRFIAIRDNIILGMGEESQMEGYVGAHTKVIDFGQEGFVMPGIHDNHVHLIQSGMFDKYVDLSGSKSEEEAAEAVRAFSQTIPEEEWVLGIGWCKQNWTKKENPTKKSLDRLLPERPVFLLDSELHATWVNSKALQIASVEDSTFTYRSGEIRRDEKGEPTGVLTEEALNLVGRYALDFSRDIVIELVDRYRRKALAWGITSVTDMTPYLGRSMAYQEVFLHMAHEERLGIRINAARDLYEEPETADLLRQKAREEGKGMYVVNHLKQFLDGVIGEHSAFMLEDYNDLPGERGRPLLDPEELKEKVRSGHERGYHIRLHACGDGAVRLGLDAYENAILAKGRNFCRHGIEHIEVIAPSDIPRFKELGVIGSVQPEHIVSGLTSHADNYYPDMIGKYRNDLSWPFNTLLAGGAVLAFGSDSPVVEGNPFMGMECGIRRVFADGTPPGGNSPWERLSMEEMLHGYTFGGAYAEGTEHILGTLEPGKIADITVLDRNLFACGLDEIKETKALMTMVDGKVVYRP